MLSLKTSLVSKNEIRFRIHSLLSLRLGKMLFGYTSLVSFKGKFTSRVSKNENPKKQTRFKVRKGWSLPGATEVSEKKELRKTEKGGLKET